MRSIQFSSKQRSTYPGSAVLPGCGLVEPNRSIFQQVFAARPAGWKHCAPRVRTTTNLLVAACCLCLFTLVARAQTLPELPAISFENFEPEIREQVRKAYEAAQAKPRDAQANGWLGMTLHSYEQYEFAAACYERAQLLAPAEFRWAYYLGITQAALGKQREAAVAFKAALKLDADHLPAQLRLADSLLAA